MSSEHDDLSTEPEPEAHGRAPAVKTELGFVVLSSPGAAELTGSWVAVGAGDQVKPRILGRGAAREDDEFERLAPVHQRPGVNQTCPPFSNRSLSRSQLLVRRTGDALEIKNVGRCALAVNGESRD